MAITQIADSNNNIGTLYEEVLKPLYGDDADRILSNTILIRSFFLNIIKKFVDSENMINIREFSTDPIMYYLTSGEYNYDIIKDYITDSIVIPNTTDLSMLNNQINNLEYKLPLVVEALSYNNVTEELWDQYLDDIFLYYADDANNPVHKIIIEDVISVFKLWNDTSNTNQKEMLKAYNANNNISYDTNTFWFEPFNSISSKYWEKFSFALTINDYDIYDSNNDTYLDIIANEYFTNGYFDEIIIKINYYYWFDNFQKITDWVEKNLKSALVSYRFNTIFSISNRYATTEEAEKYNDIVRLNTEDEELTMYKERLPILLDTILKNPQTYGFELIGGYFGKEGYSNNAVDQSIYDNEFKDYLCDIANSSPFSSLNDMYVRVFNDPNKKIFICIDNTP